MQSLFNFEFVKLFRYAISARLEIRQVFRRPPVFQIPLRVELRPLIVESVRHLVPDHHPDPSVVHCIAAFPIVTRRLQTPPLHPDSPFLSPWHPASLPPASESPGSSNPAWPNRRATPPSDSSPSLRLSLSLPAGNSPSRNIARELLPALHQLPARNGAIAAVAPAFRTASSHRSQSSHPQISKRVPVRPYALSANANRPSNQRVAPTSKKHLQL